MPHPHSEPFRRCWAEVDLAALRHNLAVIRGQLETPCVPPAGVLAVVKANAYGHGVAAVARALRGRVELFGVANVEEALELRRTVFEPQADSQNDAKTDTEKAALPRPKEPILVLGPALPDEREAMVRHRFAPVISTPEEARAFAALAEKIGAECGMGVERGMSAEGGMGAGRGPLAEPFPVHLKIDTGMGRIGVWHGAAAELAREIARTPSLRLAGIATHLPVADEDEPWTRAQLADWQTCVRRLRETLAAAPPCGNGSQRPQPPVIHALNSAGIIAFAHAAAGEGTPPGASSTLAPIAPLTLLAEPFPALVRPGLMLYGVSPIPEFQARLRPVLTWKARVTLLRDLPAGRGLSYGRTFVTPGPMRVATVCAGYADGYMRRLSGSGAQVLIGGRRCDVLGRVTMDQILVDASRVPGVAVGDEVVLLGSQSAPDAPHPAPAIPAAELARRARTIPWEIFTNISRRVARVVHDGAASK